MLEIANRELFTYNSGNMGVVVKQLSQSEQL